MTVTQHGILEDLAHLEAAYGPRLAEYVHLDRWSDVRGKLSAAACFEFGDAFPEEVHAEFAEDMIYDKGLFRLPFPVVLFSSSIGFAILACESKDADGYHLEMIQFNGIVYENITSSFPLIISNLTVDGHGEGSFVWQFIPRRSPFLPSADLRSEIEKSTLHRMNFLMAMTALLMSKDVVTEVVAPPEKLNRQRAKKGRLPIGERRIIKIRPEARERQKLARESFRSSPVMHWRRGHFRRLSEGVVIPIAPTIVGARDDAVPAIKDYVFKGGTDADSG